MSWSDLNIAISKISDQQAITAVIQSAKECSLPIRTIALTPEVGGGQLSMPADALPEDGEIGELLRMGGYAFRTISFAFSASISINISRSPNSPGDNAHIVLSSLNNQPLQVNRTQIVRLVQLLREKLKSADSLAASGLQSILTQELHQHYARREAEVARLESTISRISIQLAEDARSMRKQLDDEHQLRSAKLQEAHEQRALKLEEDANKNKAILNERELALEERAKEFDNSKSTHARRKLRQDLKAELAKRNERFTLTAGTQALRRPVFIFTSCLLIVLLVLVLAFSYSSFTTLTSVQSVSAAQLVTIIAKQLLLAVAFASTSVFFIRWNNRWFQSHADEEFRQKRFDLDLDRASWVVEMALEWKEEKGTEIPVELLERLSAGLFMETTKTSDEPLHPADQLAAAIFGASAEASIEVPGGTRVKLDRKSIKELSK